jgi:hypothetical protein
VLLSGDLPTGLSLNSATGTITGTPASTGPSTFTVSATDSSSPQLTVSADETLTVSPPLTITTTSLPSGTQGDAYAATLEATGGTAPFTWSVNGDLPIGLSLNSSTGTITGTPSSPGAWSFTASVVDSSSPTLSSSVGLTLTVAPPQLTFITTSVPDAQQNQPYVAGLEAAGGTSPYTWAISSGTLPAGLSLDTVTGVISGTPQAVGTTPFDVTVTDADAESAIAALQITVNIPPSLPFTGPTGGYTMVASDGGIFNFGNAGFLGSMGGSPLNKPIVGLATTPDGNGYWEVASDGGVFNFGDAHFYGSMGGTPLHRPIVGIASTPDGRGYWLVASDGGVFNFGDAHFYGSMGGTPLNQPVVGIAGTSDGQGYWLVAADGGIFNFGDAHFHGSMGGTPLNKPIVGLATTADGNGYWEVASDGGIFNFGDAKFYGSMGSTALNKPIVGVAGSPSPT